MRTQMKLRNQRRRGVALIISMIFLLIFSALAVSMVTVSNANLQISQNHHETNTAFWAAESGLEVSRYWLNNLSVPLSLSASERLATIAAELQDKLTDAGISNFSTSYSASEITISEVTIDSQLDQSFTATIVQIDDNTLRLDVTGTNGQFTRTIRTNFAFVTRADPIFEHGVATRGPLHMSGNGGLEMAVGADVYIESGSTEDSLVMEGNSNISGDVSINDSYGTVSLTGNASIGGQTGQEAIDNHVSIGVDAVVFPVPDVSSFEQYVQNVVDANTDLSTDLTLDNIRIAAGTNPDFTGNVTLRGIVFIEQPNIVTFSGNASVTGIIVGDGDISAPSELNQIAFSGSVDTYGVSELPDEDQFIGLKDKTGSFLLAPGFSVSFSGNSSIANGTIAANGISFTGNAGGNIQGTILNYSQTPVSITGSSNLTLSPSGVTSNPAGFTPVKALEFVPSSYSEIANSYL